MIEKLPDLVNDDATLQRWGKHCSVEFMVEVGDAQHIVRIQQGRITEVRPVKVNLVPWTFAVRAEADVWKRFWRPVPEPGFHDVIALMRHGRMKLEGDLRPLMGNLIFLKMVLEAPRKLEAAKAGGAA